MTEDQEQFTREEKSWMKLRDILQSRIKDLTEENSKLKEAISGNVTNTQLWKTDIQEFEERAIEIFETFLESLPTIDLTKESADSEYRTFIDEGFTFIYPQQSSKLARRMLDRLYKVGSKYFPNEKYIDISTHMWREL